MFRFKNFELQHERSTLKVGTESVLLAAAVPMKQPKRILDIGCGCGVIGFGIADRLIASGFSDFQLIGIDIDEPSIAEARLNAEKFRHRSGRPTFDFRQTALQDFTSSQFHLIVSNPPFFGNSLKPTDCQRLRSKHRDNLLSFETLTQKVAELLAPDGFFYLILPRDESDDFCKIVSHRLFLCEKIDIRPIVTKSVHRRILGFSGRMRDMRSSSLVIRDSDGNYTPEYCALTACFYLNM